VTVPHAAFVQREWVGICATPADGAGGAEPL
jgi:hypothetical protein